jgi:hypothetical protein
MFPSKIGGKQNTLADGADKRRKIIICGNLCNQRGNNILIDTKCKVYK